MFNQPATPHEVGLGLHRDWHQACDSNGGEAPTALATLLDHLHAHRADLLDHPHWSGYLRSVPSAPVAEFGHEL